MFWVGYRKVSRVKKILNSGYGGVVMFFLSPEDLSPAKL